MKKKKKLRAKLKEKTLTLEEVFSQVALAPPSVSRSNILLTPLSSEACLAKGINPDALQKREFEVFRHNSSDLEIQRLKYEAYETRRHELMETAMKEKTRLSKKNKRIDGEDESITLSEDQSLRSSSVLTKQERGTATMMEIEAKRLKKARDKQKRELLQLLHFEQKMDKIQSDIQLKAERDALAEERMKAKKKKQERRQAEERRVRELRRKAQEDAEEEMHRINTRQRFEKEIQIKKEKERQEMETRRREREEKRFTSNTIRKTAIKEAARNREKNRRAKCQRARKANEDR
jgi:hypothetical protein